MVSDGRAMAVLMSEGLSTNFVRKSRLLPSQREDENTWLAHGAALCADFRALKDTHYSGACRTRRRGHLVTE